MSTQPYRVQYNQDLGGDKIDYMPATDPTTDRSASNVNDGLASIAGAVATQPMGIIKINSGTSISTKLIAFQDNGLWSVSKSSTGVYVLKFYTSVYDSRNILQTWNPLFCSINVDSHPYTSSAILGSGSDGSGNFCTVTSGIINYSGVAVDPTSCIIQIW